MSIDALLDFIAAPESNNNPNAVWAGISSEDRPPRPLTRMTVGEVLDWQDYIDAEYRSEAAGAWQFLEDTLRDIYAPAGVSLTDLFDERTQRKLALYLLRRRRLEDYLAGRITAETFAQNLSKEWASLPCITRDKRNRPAQGQSYYAGDGLNKAHVSIEDTLAAVRAVKSTTKKGSDMSAPGQGEYIVRLALLILTGSGATATIAGLVPGVDWTTVNGVEGFFVNPEEILNVVLPWLIPGGSWLLMKRRADKLGGKT